MKKNLIIYLFAAIALLAIGFAFWQQNHFNKEIQNLSDQVERKNTERTECEIELEVQVKMYEEQWDIAHQNFLEATKWRKKFKNQ